VTWRALESLDFVVPPELAEVAERLGVPLRAGDRVRFEVVDDGTEGMPATDRRSSGAVPALPRQRTSGTEDVVRDAPLLSE
jgi:hypothetical protein